ncbi:MAG: hypothetical protein U5L75_00525 [Candidatus Campbellbacteria bacterium]|nr:hypothetical protein [Candidatus Campbellbacteria bacterium]
MNKKQQFGIYSAGIGAGVLAVAMIVGTLDTVQVVASTILVLTGSLLYFFGR